MPEKNIADFIQGILDKHNGFMKVKDIVPLISIDMKRKLCLKGKKTSAAAVIKRLENVLADEFIFRKSGNTKYIFTPCLPSDIVMSFLKSGEPVSPKALVKRLPFTKSEFADIISRLEASGKIITIYNEKLEASIVMNDLSLENGQTENQQELSGEYTPEKFREAFEKSDKGRTFVRIFKMRRYLRWPREVFDNMVMALLREGKIFVHPAEPTVLKPDEYEDSFMDEFGDMNGTVTWND